MKIVHLSNNGYAQAEKVARPSKREARKKSSSRWVEIQEQANYQKALREFGEAINEIRDLYDPNFRPFKV